MLASGGWPIRELAGTELGFVGTVIMVKEHWAEFTNSFGFPAGAYHTNPCILCDASGVLGGAWRDIESISIFSLPW